MARVLPLLAFAILLLPGCAQPAPGGQGGTDDAPAEDAPTQEDGNRESEQTVSPRPSPPQGNAAEAVSQTWFLHIDRTCDGQDLCNCGSTRTFMDRDNTTDDCDAHGDRPFHRVPAVEPQFVLAESWPDEVASSAWPADSRLDGVLYVTTDVRSSYDYFLRLRSGETTYAESAPRQGTAEDGRFGFQFSALPFDAALASGIPGGVHLVLEFHIRWHAGATSYFIGYDDDHASRFTLAPPD